jgi:hypothetical protein
VPIERFKLVWMTVWLAKGLNEAVSDVFYLSRALAETYIDLDCYADLGARQAATQGGSRRALGSLFAVQYFFPLKLFPTFLIFSATERRFWRHS